MIQEPHSEALDIGEMVMHHTADAWTIDLQPFGTIHLPRWPDVHIGSWTVNLSPTKHVEMLLLAAVLVMTGIKLAAPSVMLGHPTRIYRRPEHGPQSKRAKSELKACRTAKPPARGGSSRRSTKWTQGSPPPAT